MHFTPHFQVGCVSVINLKLGLSFTYICCVDHVLTWLKNKVKPIWPTKCPFQNNLTYRNRVRWEQCCSLPVNRCENIYRVANNNLAEIMSCWKEKYLYTGLWINAVAWRQVEILPKSSGWCFAFDGSHRMVPSPSLHHPKVLHMSKPETASKTPCLFTRISE